MRDLPGDEQVMGLEVTTPLNDFLCYQRVKALPFLQNKALPALGGDHPNKARFPNHKLTAIAPDGDEGWLRFYYMAPRASQEQYNWEYAETLENEWPEVRQTWVVPRAEYEPGPIAAPPDLGGRTWSYIGEREQRTGDARTDGLFVVAIHIYQDISTERVGAVLDAETGELVPTAKGIVPAGTPGQGVDATGTYRVVSPLNRLWSVRDTRQAAGLAGQAVDGVKARAPYRIVMNYPFPAVLSHIELLVIPGLGNTVAAMFSRPVWLREAYSGPVEATVTEVWSKEDPEIDAPTPLLPMPIVFQGALLQISVPACLHPELTLWESSGSGTETLAPYQLTMSYPATNEVDWPATMVAIVTKTPMFGGFLVRTYTVDRPAFAVVANRIVLMATGLPDGITLDWTLHNSTGAVTDYYVTISTDAGMSFGFVVNDLDVNTVLTYTTAAGVLARGTAYYCRVRAVIGGNSYYSNTVSMVMVPAPMIQVEQPAATVLTDNVSTINFGGAVIGAGTADKTFTIRNVGDQTLRGLALAVTGTNAADWSVQTALSAVQVAAGGTATFTLRFAPGGGSAGARTAAVAISNDDPRTGANPFTVTLSGEATAPEIAVGYESGPKNFVDGVTAADFGSGVNAIAVSTPSPLVFGIVNLGTANLTGLAITIDGAHAAEFVLTAAATAPVAPLSGTTFEITFTPAATGVRTAVAHIASNDSDENPFDIPLTGEGV